MCELDCPFCHKSFESLSALEAHANAHFDDKSPTAEPQDVTAACEHCGQQIALSELASHEAAHELTAAGQPQLQAADAMQQLADAEFAASIDDDAAHERQLEELYFEELRARYGFTPQRRPGCCRLCEEPGHWAKDCPTNPDNQEAQRRIVRPPLPAAIIASQQPATHTKMPGGQSLIELLAACLEQGQVASSAGYQAALCGEVAHLGSSHFSYGWGCGYNNMQMLASHLLAADAEARRVLFGGAGWVPDIPALQAWLEAAWQAGFDRHGAEQLGWQVQGTKKWVGTTECAALLHSFGIRAHIVDFGVPSGTLRAADSSVQDGARVSRESLVPLHPGVGCDGCGQMPIVGDRYRSETLPNYDLCSKCHGRSEFQPAAPFCRMMPGMVRMAPPQSPQQGAACGSEAGLTMQAQLLRWIWRYFAAEDGQNGSTNEAGSGRGGQSGAHAEVGEGHGSAKRARRSPAPRLHLSGKPPLYFQHEGHSRTIIGVERRLVGQERRAEFTLLILDPSTPGPRLAAALERRSGWQRLVKRGAHTVRHTQYQLMFVQAGLATGAELEQLKVLAATERYGEDGAAT